jgi:isoamylase
VAPGTRYGFRVHGRWDPGAGIFSNPAKLLLDPYARQMAGELRPHESLATQLSRTPGRPSTRDNSPFVPRSVVVGSNFDWGDDRPPLTPWEDTFIYEVHVKGMTINHQAVPDELRGTYGALTTEPVIEHLRALGVTTIELLPVQYSLTEPILGQRGLTNYWGYNPIGWFAPQARYAAGDDPVDEFKEMVRGLHLAGFEVILDVVYNHTAEGNHQGPVLSFRGFDNPGFYRLDPADNARYLDVTGTGNTVDLTLPWSLRIAMDSLRYWVEEMHVDGFRFDLAVACGRVEGRFTRHAGFFAAIGQDPVLRRVKLIAEPWDLGPHGYQLGEFPAGWAEWNGRFRDHVRDFWGNNAGLLSDLAARLTGSADLFGQREPQASINFITSHDGFTVADLVSYEHKQNLANGEHNEDGEGHNRSWNSGVEGPTDDPAVIDIRRHRRRSMLATMFVSQGVPMLLGGDELGRTQGGNNNAYCQDNETSWFGWDAADWEQTALVQRMSWLRRHHRVLRQAKWLDGGHQSNGLPDIAWYTPEGGEMDESDWQVEYARTLTVFLNGSAVSPTDASLLLVFNARHEAHLFSLPGALDHLDWQVELDTADDLAGRLENVFEVQPFSVLVAKTGHRPATPPG